MGALWRASGKRYFSPPRPTPSNRVFSTTVSVAGKRIFEGRDKEPERASKVQERRCGDRISLSNPPIQGLFDENREISVRPRVCGGPGRTRTSSQAVMRAVTAGKFQQFSPLRRTFADFDVVWLRLLAQRHVPAALRLLKLPQTNACLVWPKPSRRNLARCICSCPRFCWPHVEYRISPASTV
jgi:hypothetical protein